MSNSKPAQKPNPNYSSTTGNPSGCDRGNTKKPKKLILKKNEKMKKKIKPADNSANNQNPNIEVNENNKQYDQNHGNRGK